MARPRPNAPASRNGVAASCVVLPQGPWPTILDFLAQRFPNMASSVWQERMDAGLLVDDHGAVVSARTPFTTGLRMYYYRDVPLEAIIPFEATVLYQDAHLLVADKPHFLPVMPSGNYLHQTLLLRLQSALGLPWLTPIHRIDRDTAGLVMFSINPGTRDAYHALFRERQVSKIYLAVAPFNPKLTWPQFRSTRIAESAHFMQQVEVEGVPNADTQIELLENTGGLGLYQLKPASGHRHQLRVHMNALGLPILNDGIYPVLTPEGSSSFDKPLQLLARQLDFTDPVTGKAQSFTSQLQLDWPPSQKPPSTTQA